MRVGGLQPGGAALAAGRLVRFAPSG